MTDPRDLFRPEAIEAHARGHQPRRVIDVRPAPTRRVFAAVIVASLAAVLLSVAVHTTSTTSGPAVAGSSQVVALLPAAVAGRLAVGQPATGPGWHGKVAAVGPVVADGLLGAERIPGVWTVVHFSGPVPPRWRGRTRVEVTLGHPTIAVLVFPGLRGWLDG